MGLTIIVVASTVTELMVPILLQRIAASSSQYLGLGLQEYHAPRKHYLPEKSLHELFWMQRTAKGQWREAMSKKSKIVKSFKTNFDTFRPFSRRAKNVK